MMEIQAKTIALSVIPAEAAARLERRLKRQMIERLIAGGRTPKEAERWYRRYKKLAEQVEANAERAVLGAEGAPS